MTDFNFEQATKHPKKGPRQMVLEEFLGDSVTRVTLGLYVWRNKYYEVIPKALSVKRHNWSGFIWRTYYSKTYMLREASTDVIKKYYPKVVLDK